MDKNNYKRLLNNKSNFKIIMILIFTFLTLFKSIKSNNIQSIKVNENSQIKNLEKIQNQNPNLNTDKKPSLVESENLPTPNITPEKNQEKNTPTETQIEIQTQNSPEIIKNSIESNFFESTLKGFSVLYFAEIGDKTFFLIIIYSADNTFLKTLLVASSVLLSWNFVSMIIGSSMPVLLFPGFFDILGATIFFIFGFAMLYSAYHMENHFINKGLNETKSELSRKSSLRRSNSIGLGISFAEEKANLVNKDNNLNEPLLDTNENSNQKSNTSKLKKVKSLNIEVNNKRNYIDLENLEGKIGTNTNSISNSLEIEDEENEEFGFHSSWAFASALFLGELGDKSQISSIIMGSGGNFYAILLGTSIGRFFGVITAILLGKFISNNITHKQVTYLSSFIFLFFGVAYLVKFFYQL
jgi:putative Ca2+/H+ antiporter (TMEM165/GDT1 family)